MGTWGIQKPASMARSKNRGRTGRLHHGGVAQRESAWFAARKRGFDSLHLHQNLDICNSHGSMNPCRFLIRCYKPIINAGGKQLVEKLGYLKMGPA